MGTQLQCRPRPRVLHARPAHQPGGGLRRRAQPVVRRDRTGALARHRVRRRHPPGGAVRRDGRRRVAGPGPRIERPRCRERAHVSSCVPVSSRRATTPHGGFKRWHTARDCLRSRIPCTGWTDAVPSRRGGHVQTTPQLMAFTGQRTSGCCRRWREPLPRARSGSFYSSAARLPEHRACRPRRRPAGTPGRLRPRR